MKIFPRLFPLLVGVVAAFGGLMTRRFLLVDQCADIGGRWDDGARVCRSDGGAMALSMDGTRGIIVAIVAGLMIAGVLWLLMGRIAAARARVARAPQ
jgi:hypothetical protein